MKAIELIELLQQVPEQTEVEVTTSDADDWQFGRDYTAHIYFGSHEAKEPNGFVIEIEYDEKLDKTDLPRKDNHQNDPGIDKGPMNVIETREPFKNDVFEYGEYRYLEGHRPGSVWNERKLIQGIHLDPSLPESFENYPNEYRPDLEKADWWGLPFIVSRVYVENDKVKTSFSVRLLDGGAWDRSTGKGIFDDIDSALSVAKLLKEG